ncbi:MAG: hypothetical protein Q9222_001777 [Ikaeria aurantiellina]
MFGHDMSWASFHVLEVMSSPKYLQKRVGYLGAVQSFRPDTEVLMLATNLLKKDITSPSLPTIALPLVTLPHIITPALALSLLSDLLPRLSHSSPNVRKKTIVALYRLALVHPETLRPAWPKIKELLMHEDEDSSVTAAAINVVCELGWRRPRDFLPLAPRLFELLVDGGNNWMAIKIIKLFATLTPLEPRLTKKLLPPLATLIRTTPAMSLLYECINGIVQGGILESVDGIREGEEIAALCVGKLRGMIVVEGDPNCMLPFQQRVSSADHVAVKYVALLAFQKLVLSHPDLVALHSDVIMSCIDDHDVSIRLQALDLSAGIVNTENITRLVNRLLEQLHHSPARNNGNVAGHRETTTIQPSADSDGEDPEQVLRLSKDSNDGASALSPEYRTAAIKQILDVCTKDTYSNIANFEWYIDVLVQLVKLVPQESMHVPSLRDTSDRPSADFEATSEETSARLGRELCNVAVRVRSVREEVVRAAALLLLDFERQQSNTTNEFGGRSALGFAAWIAGEYAEHLSDLHSTLNSLIHPKVLTLPSTGMSTYLQAIPKVLIAIISRMSSTWNREIQTRMSLLLAKLLFFLEPLTSSPTLEVQERAVELLELIRIASQAVNDHPSHNDHWPRLLTKAIPQLFTGTDLNPVAASAQRRISLPDDIDLEVHLNPDLVNLLQSVEHDVSPAPEAADFQAFYVQRSAPSSTDAKTAITNKAPVLEPEMSSYQNTLNITPDEDLVQRKRSKRRLKNRDDPYYINSDEMSSGSSTPFHAIIGSTNGEGVDVDSIPIMSLELGERIIHDTHSGSEESVHKKMRPKKYEIAADENVELDDSSESLHRSGAKSEADRSRREQGSGKAKKSLLQVDSSRLQSVALESHAAGDARRDVERQAAEDADMARALQEVERLRLEMQRATERVQIGEGVPPEGTLVKKKKVKKKSTTKDSRPSRLISQETQMTNNEAPRNHDEADYRGHANAPVPHNVATMTSVVRKKKKRKKVGGEP